MKEIKRGARTLTVKWSVLLPAPPNFLRSTGGQPVDIAHVTDEGLRKLGAEWTEQLVSHAQSRRKAES